MKIMQYIQDKYLTLCETKSDIHEHLPTLFEYASKCNSVIECGVRRCVSSWALLYGLLQNNSNTEPKQILLNDIVPCNIDDFLDASKDLDIEIKYAWCSNIHYSYPMNYDLVFIDTWHVYGQLKRELNVFGKIINKYIIMHDTTVDEIYSESVRNKHDISQKMADFDYTYDEVTIGLGKAIDEFLLENTEWKQIAKFTNNNGLTILEKKE